MNYEKEKCKDNSTYSCIKRSKISRNKFNQRGKRLVLRKLKYTEEKI